MRRALLGLLIAASCHAGRPAEFPDASADTKSMLVAMVLPRGGLRVQAFAWPDDRPHQIGALRNTKVTVLYYAQTLEQLGLEPGELPDARGETYTRRLPRADATWASTVRVTGLDPWEQRTDLDSELDEFRIPGGSITECATTGGCFVTAADVSSGSCAATCPEPTAATLPTPPTPPAAPDFGTCPPGWRTIASEGVDVCRPPDRTCNGDQFIGDTTCGVVGSACEPDGWPAVVPGDRPLRYVDASVAPGGTGTRTDPYDTIAAAMNGAPALVGIVLRRGTHAAGATSFTGVVQLVGACASETNIQLGGTWDVTGNASELGLTDVTVQGGSPAISVSGSAKLIAESAVFTGGGSGATPAIRGGEVELTRVVIHDAQGVAVHVANAALTVNDVVVRDSDRAAFRIDNVRMAMLEDVVVERTADSALLAANGSIATVTRAYFSNVVGDTVSVSGADVGLDYVVIEDGQDRNGRNGIGVFATGDGTVVAERTLIARAKTAAGWFSNATVTWRDVVVREVFVEPERGWHGMAVAALDGSSVKLERVDIADSHRWGILSESQASTDADDLAIRRVQRGGSGDTNSVGFEVRTGGSAVVDRLVVEGAYTSAMAFDDGEVEEQTDCSALLRTGMLRVTDADLSGTEDLTPLIGIEAGCDSELTLERVRVRGMRGWGFDFTQSAKISAVDIDIEGSVVRNLDTFFDARFTGTRVRLADSKSALRADFRGVVDLTDASIDCGEGERTLGLVQNNFGEVTLDSFEISNCDVAVYGLFSEFVDLEDGFVHDNGIAIETDAGVEKFLLRVRYQDNEVLESPYNPNRL